MRANHQLASDAKRRWFFDRSYVVYNRLKLEVMLCFGCGLLATSNLLEKPVHWPVVVAYGLPVVVILVFEPYRRIVLGVTLGIVAGRALLSSAITGNQLATGIAVTTGVLGIFLGVSAERVYGPIPMPPTYSRHELIFDVSVVFIIGIVLYALHLLLSS